MIPEMIDLILNKNPNSVESSKDMASALYISAWSLGELIGPLIGGLLMEKFYFKRMGGILGFFMIVIFILYYVLVYMRRVTRLNIK